MGFLDNLLKREKPKEKVKIYPTIDIQKVDLTKDSQKIDITKDNQADPQVLSDKIKLNFTKLNLDKPEVLSDTAFLLDVSGSMSAKVGKERKIDHLRNVMGGYPAAKKFSFSDNVHDEKNIPEPNGSTDLAKAFRYLRNTGLKPKRVVLVSDGEPNEESSALNEAKELAIPIDIIFIGDKGSRGERFMEKLASASGGQHMVV